MKQARRFASLLLTTALLLSGCWADPPEAGQEAVRNPDFTLDSSLEGLSLAPEESDGAGVSVESAFLLDAPGNPSLSLLRSTLEMEPPIPFELEQLEGGRVRLSLSEPMEANAVYTFRALTAAGDPALSWAFQTKPVFSLLRTTPAGGSAGVSLNSGIEFQFSYDGVDISSHFTIHPPVEGSFVTKDNRSVFMPRNQFMEDASYTVTLSADLSLEDGQTLGKSHSFSFRTAKMEYYPTGSSSSATGDFYINNSVQETFLTQDVPLIEINTYSLPPDQDFHIQVFSLPPDRYADELLEYHRRRFDPGYTRTAPYLAETKDLEAAMEFTVNYTPLASLDGSDYEDPYLEKHLIFPDSMEAGHYLAQVTVVEPTRNTTVVRQKLLQINDNAVYHQSVNGNSLAWVNQVEGLPVTGAHISLQRPLDREEIGAGSLDGDGVALLETGEEPMALLRLSNGDGEFIDLVSLSAYREPSPGERYTSFLYSDRNIYRPTDKVQVWGIARGRSEDLPSGGSLELQLFPAFGYGEEEDPPLQAQPVVLESDGTFLAEMELEKLVSGTYSLRLVDGGEMTVRSLNLVVEDYEKPEYVQEAYSDKLFYLPGETIDMNARVSFFEGTPLWNYKLLARTADGGEIPLSTDENGEVRTGFEVPPDSGWQPRTLNYSFANREADRYEMKFGNRVIYFPSQVVMQVEQTRFQDNLEVTVRANALDTSGLESQEDIYRNYPESFLGEPVDLPIHVTVTSHSHTREVSGTYYDWTAKQVRYSYNYIYQTEELDSYDALVEDGVLVLRDLPQPGFGVSYTVAVTAEDPRGQALSQSVGLSVWKYGGAYRYAGDNLKSYSFELEERYEVEDPYSGSHWYNYSLSYDSYLYGYDSYSWNYYSSYTYDYQTGLYSVPRTRYGLGDEIRLKLLNNREQEENQGRILYAAVQDRFLYTGAVTGDVVSLEQIRENIPNVRLTGAYFDGRNIYPVDGVGVTYDYEAEELTIQIEADQERYGPGDEVALSLTVLDREERPVAARISLSVVDEAIFALREQSLSPLANLYASCFSYPSSSYASHVQHRFFQYSYGGKGGGGSDGGGGGEGFSSTNLRSEFLDTAQFFTVSTGEDGTGRATFHLPDNITSWRVTGVALAEDVLRAGTQIAHVDASLPMFLQVLSNEDYLAGDDVGFTVRTYGSQMTGSIPVRYRAEIAPKEGSPEGFPLVQEKKGRSNLHTNFNFGRLPLGSYTLTVWGGTNDYTDGLAYDIEVISSALEVQVARTQILDPGKADITVNSKRYPVLVGFADARYTPYLRAVNRLSRGQYNRRGDQMVAAVAAKRSMSRYMGSADAYWLGYMREDPLSDFIQSAGSNHGIALYPYDSPDPFLTAKALVLLGTSLEEAESMGNYLQSVVDNGDQHPKKEVAAALMGLAALKRPVLAEVRGQLAAPYLLTQEEQIYLCAALALLGDQEGAREVYDNYIAANYMEVGNLKYLQAPEGTPLPDANQLNALALMAAAVLDHEDAPVLADYLLDFHTDAYRLELAVYVKEFRPSYEGKTVVSYQKNGEQQELSLRRSGVRYVSLMGPDLAADAIQVLEGQAVVSVHYTGDREELVRIELEEGQTGEREESDEIDPNDGLKALRDMEADEIGELTDDELEDMGLTRNLAEEYLRRREEGLSGESTLPDQGEIPEDGAEEEEDIWDPGELVRIKKEIFPVDPDTLDPMPEPLAGEEQSGAVSGLYRVRITITFHEDAPVGLYYLDERIPSPLRFNKSTSRSGSLSRRERQNLRYTIHHARSYAWIGDRDDPNNQVVTYQKQERVVEYLARLTYEGAYQLEDVVLQHEKSQMLVVGEVEQAPETFRNAMAESKRQFGGKEDA